MAAAALSPAEHDRIAAAVRAAEANTSGEIYVVVSLAADASRFVPVVWAALLALLVPWPLLFLTPWSTEIILMLQALVFVAGALVGSHPALRHRLVPAGVAEETSRRAAQSLFLAHGVHLTQERTGVLIYVALADRRVQIVADALINRHVAQSAWDEIADMVAAAAKQAALADGLVGAVHKAGELLAQHFPRARDDRNELPDRVVEI